MEQQRERARAASQVLRRPRASSTRGGKTEFHGYDKLALPAQGRRAVSRGRAGAGAEERRHGHRGARRDAVLRRVRRPGRRPGRARRLGRHLRGRRHAEDPGRRVRPPRHAEDRRAEGRRPGRGAGRHGAARAHHAQPLGHAPHAQGAARGARPARAAEGLAGRRRQDALRLLAQQAADATRRSARSRRA